MDEELTPFHGPPAGTPRIPGFTARTLLGFGAHGEVWLAQDRATGEQVAVKVGRPDGAGGPHRADRETALLCRIDHPHVVRLRQVVPLPRRGEVALVLDLAAGGSLASLVAGRGAFAPGEVSTLLVPLAQALDHLHRSGLVHGDIAPGNVLFTADGRPQLGDLGVARVLGTRAEGGWSTPGFTDPALTRPGAADVDPRAVDLWGLAAIGWFALTGRPPTPDGLDGPPRPAGMPAGIEAAALARLLAECLSAEPAARPGLAELAERAWQAAAPRPIQLLAPVPRVEPVDSFLAAGQVDAADQVNQPGELADPFDAPGEGGLPPLSSRVTRRVAALDPPEPAVEAPARRRLGRLRSGRAVAVGAAVGLAVALVAAWFGFAAGPLARPGPAAAAAAGSKGASAATAASTHAPTSASSALTAELTRWLTELGRRRASAFATGSARGLTRVDETGSPAHQADLALVRRLRERGYRLTGVHYELRGVRVLGREGAAVRVAAQVTTSRHLQVRLATRAGTLVAAEGPRAVVFTVVPAPPPATGWRIRSVTAP